LARQDGDIRAPVGVLWERRRRFAQLEEVAGKDGEKRRQRQQLVAAFTVRPDGRSVSQPVGWTRQGKAESSRRIMATHLRDAAKRNVILRLKRVRRAPASNRQ
jgi:hypothetical protein